MKARRVFLFYLIATLGFTLALLLFFGIVIGNSAEMMSFQKLSVLGKMLPVALIIIIFSSFCYTLRPAQTLQIKLISDFMLCLSVFGFALFVAVRGGAQETWFSSFEKLLGRNVFSFGCCIGFSVVSAQGGLRVIRLCYGKAYRKLYGIRNNLFIIAGIMLCFGLFSVGTVALWRYRSPLDLIFICLAVSFFLFIFTFLFCLYVLNDRSVSLLTEEGQLFLGEYHRLEPSEMLPISCKYPRLKAIYIKLYSSAGYNPQKSDFISLWIALVFLCLFCLLGLLGSTCDVKIYINDGKTGHLGLFPLLTFCFGLVYILCLLSLSAFEFISKKETGSFAFRSIVRFFEGIFVTISIALVLYPLGTISELPLYFLKELVFIMLGSLTFIAVSLLSKRFLSTNISNIITKLLFVIALVGLLVSFSLNFGSVFGIKLSPAASPYPRSAAIYSVSGVAIGIIFADKNNTVVFGGKNRSIGNPCEIGLILGILFLTILGISFGRYTAFLRGEIVRMAFFESVSDKSSVYALSIIGEIIILLAVIFGALNGWIFVKKEGKEKTPFFNKREKTKDKPKEKINFIRTLPAILKKRGIAIVLLVVSFCSVVVVSLACGIATETFSEKIVAEGDGYYIWTADSDRRIMREARVAKSRSKLVDFVEINVGKNEYGCCQLIWYSQNEIIDISTEIEISTADGEKISEYGLYLAEGIFDEKTPDILMPINGQKIQQKQHSTLFFEFLTSINQPTGVYDAEIKLSFASLRTKHGKIIRTEETQIISVKIIVNNYLLRGKSGISYLIYGKTGGEQVKTFAQRRLTVINSFIDEIINDELFDEDKGIWRWDRELSPELVSKIIEEYKPLGWNEDRYLTYGDLWRLWAELQVFYMDSFNNPCSVIKAYSAIEDYLYDDKRTLSNIEYKNDGYYNKVYGFYYSINQLLSDYTMNNGEKLLDRMINFYEPKLSERSLERVAADKEISKRLNDCWKLELIAMTEARTIARRDFGLSKGIAYIAGDAGYVDKNMLGEYFDGFCIDSYENNTNIVDYCSENNKEIWLRESLECITDFRLGLSNSHILSLQAFYYGIKGYVFMSDDVVKDKNECICPNGALIYKDKSNTYHKSLSLASFMKGADNAEIFLLLERTLNEMKDTGRISVELADAELAEYRNAVCEILDLAKKGDYYNELLHSTVAKAERRISELLK